ncbi:acetylcholinesterase-1 [Parasteatoda tepidariorum]|uniref:acetylcholinesterase-1 n=1 Tax=Parasteatoda tepidariorum TaxID=114398 RepID=UPI001C71B2A7|nr:acetylcholinesterase-1 [Parasteatoda tepidariorum]XP_015926155.2 acetylcholinesterase-1 [Parasteatoda tepidariorum]
MWFMLMILAPFLQKCSSKCQVEPTVDIPLGKIMGKTVFFDDIPVFTFQSIPYAKPPLNDKRFKRTEPVEPWDQPLLATHLPPACVQHSSNPFPWLDDFPGHSEDCLYLNIWVPTNASSLNKKPVMFYIHGGGFRISSSRIDFYDGRVLAALGDVIVVNTNYRLGALGFLYLGIEDAPGNMGIHDIYESLKWVRSNIESFGGDKHRITLFGQSAGAISIGMFMTSPAFNGIFHRAIMESGTAATLRGKNNAKDTELGELLAKGIGCARDNKTFEQEPEKVVNCLKGADALNLTKVSGNVNPNPQSGYFPRYGDNLLPHDPRLSLIKGDFMPVDLLIGANHNEGSISITKEWTDVFGFFGEKTSKINKTFGEKILKNIFLSFPYRKAVIQRYLGDLDEDCDDILYQVQAAIGDLTRICPSIYLAETVAQKNDNVYFYFFKHRPSNSPFAPWMGVVHFDETPFAFGYPLRYPQNYTAYEVQLSLEMVHVWTSFAKNGFPSIPWPKYSKRTHRYKAFEQKTNTLKVGPHLESCNFFRKSFGF